MNILFFIDGFKGGAGNVVQLLSKELNSRGHHITICCLGVMTPGRYDLTGIDVRKLNPKSNRYISYINYILYVRRTVKEIKPDCVVSFLFGVSSFVNLGLKGIKVPHVLSERSDPNYLKPHGLLYYLTLNAYKNCRKIVVLFDAFKNIGEGKYIDKVYTIPNPVPVIDVESHCIDYKSIKFVTVANDTPPKGLDILIDAFSQASMRYPGIKLRIYGAQKDSKLKELISGLGAQESIELMGYTLNIKEPLEWADVYVMPSRHEGFPNSLCEAMSAGKCCIATMCHQGIKELITEGENGLIATTASSTGIYNQIEKIILNPVLIPIIGERAKLISSKYKIQDIASQWEELIKECIDK